MAKRPTGVGKGKKKSPHKTAKRLAVKNQMLLKKVIRNRKHNTHISPGKIKLLKSKK